MTDTTATSSSAPSTTATARPKRNNSFRTAMRQLLMALISFSVVLLLWELTVGTLFNPLLVPSPGATFSKAWEMMLSGELFLHIYVSLKRVVVGYVLGCIFGVVIGALVGRIRIIRELTDPILEVVRPISPVAMIPLAMLWFGIGEMSKYFVILYATVIIVLLNTAAGVQRTPTTRIRAARCLGATDFQVFTKVVLPSAVPFILTGMRVALGFSFMGIVAAELIGAREGIGFLIMNSRLLLNTEQLFVGLLALGIVGAIIDRVFRTVLARSARRYMQHEFGDV